MNKFIPKSIAKYFCLEIKTPELENKILDLQKENEQLREKLAHERIYPISWQTVDIAIINHDNLPFNVNYEILLGRKPNQTKFQFIGGFSDPTSPSLEVDAKREVAEETGLEVDDIFYIGSTLIDDERYRSSVDKIKTAFFVATKVFNKAVAGDDIQEVRWFPIYNDREFSKSLDKNLIVDKHHVLVDLLRNHLTFPEYKVA
jgi:8-oxo-dGTP pyrophosphatase MutT (NUDIX family)